MTVSPATQSYISAANVAGGYTILPVPLIGKIFSYLSDVEVKRASQVSFQGRRKLLTWELAHKKDADLLDIYLTRVGNRSGFEQIIPSPYECKASTPRVFSATCDQEFETEGVLKLKGTLATLRLLRLHFPNQAIEGVHTNLAALDWKKATELQWIFVSGNIEIETDKLVAFCRNFSCKVRMLSSQEAPDSPNRDQKSTQLAGLLSNQNPPVPTERTSSPKSKGSPPRATPQARATHDERAKKVLFA